MELLAGRKISSYSVFRDLHGRSSACAIIKLESPDINCPLLLVKKEVEKTAASRELEAYERLQGVNHVVKLYNCEDTSSDKAAMFCEYCANGNLLQAANQDQLSVKEKCRIVTELIETLAEIHSRGICHGNIKPEKLLITCQKGVRIADFSRYFDFKTQSIAPTPSPCTGQPLNFRKRRYRSIALERRSSDIREMGIAIYRFITCDFDSDIVVRLAQGGADLLLNVLSDEWKQLKRVLRAMLSTDVEDPADLLDMMQSQFNRDLTLELIHSFHPADTP